MEVRPNIRMKILLFLAFVALVSGVPLNQEENKKLQGECGRTYIRARYSKSVHTTPGARYIAPFTVQLHLVQQGKSADSQLPTGICTGTIISPRHVLTAARCIADYKYQGDSLQPTTPSPKIDKEEFRRKLDNIYISAPANDDHGKQRKRHNCGKMVETVVVRPMRAFISKDYVDNEWGYKRDKRGDIAVIELQETENFSVCIQPACLYPEKIEENILLTLYGYGATDDGIRDIGTMRKHKSKTASKEACLNYSYFQWSEIDSHFKISKGYNLSSDEICSESDKSMVCLGDKGAGLIIKQSYLANVVAVNSWGPLCLPELENRLDGRVEVNTGIYHHLDWICVASGVCLHDLTEEEKDLLRKNYTTIELEGSMVKTV